MATVSFDEKVVVKDPEVVAQMRKDLDDPSPVVLQRKTRTEKCTLEQTEQNAKKWILK